MVTDEMKHYLEGLIPNRSPEIEQIEIEARENSVPIMDLIGMEALLQVLRIHKPKQILEIGTAIGYSAVRIIHALKESQLVTIERDHERYTKAVDNILKCGLTENITVLEGDALELIEEVGGKGPYDFIFIDAAKGQYERFFTAFEKMLTPGGVIISDNVLFRGFVSKQDEDINSRRFRKLTHKIRSYNEFLIEHTNYHTTILPVGDGMAVSINKK
ncbi:O-methyltransferase [Alkalihalobacillus sp. AL-G]|uniref:O-methyltransferase n=1 Tax=Alkalihalobacillus sp. AL-G TaxID=2926399 RepID=UPI00272D9928|nr:O-methyltransferase [Alkalihalobacillus sp. AL-G]WLD92187.1 O-methyltransferase [Alkalihalobacillus sp. AL-G]